MLTYCMFNIRIQHRLTKVYIKTAGEGYIANLNHGIDAQNHTANIAEHVPSHNAISFIIGSLVPRLSLIRATIQRSYVIMAQTRESLGTRLHYRLSLHFISLQMSVKTIHNVISHITHGL